MKSEEKHQTKPKTFGGYGLQFVFSSYRGKQRKENKTSVLILWNIFLLEGEKKCFAYYKFSSF